MKVKCWILDDNGGMHEGTAEMRYNTADPFAVTFAFGPGTENENPWTFGRDLLTQALNHEKAGKGDVFITPDYMRGIPVLAFCLRNPKGHDHIVFRRQDVENFYTKTTFTVPLGREVCMPSLDRELARILGA